MNWVNFDDVQRQLVGAGLFIDKPLNLDARIQRWKVDGEDNEKRGWSRLKEWVSKSGACYIVGSFGVWHGTDDGYTKIEMSKDSAPELSKEDMAAIRAAQKAASVKLAQERRAEAKLAGRWAAAVWSHCSTCTEHEYLTRKQIQPHGARLMETLDGLTLTGIDTSNHYRLMMAIGALVIPMHDEHANVCGIQFIYPSGRARAKKIERDKEFWPSGMAMSGTFGLIGHIKRDGIILVTEGFATAASLNEATGQTVAYAFSANNLVKAGKLLRKTCPQAKLLFCADDDYLTDGNPGCTYASQASAEIERSAWVKPDFNDENGNDRRAGKKLTDFNDLAILTGLPLTLANQINAKLDTLKWRDTSTSARDHNKPGEGECSSGDIKRRKAQSVMSLDSIVERFMPLDDGTGKFVFDTWTNKVAHREQMVTLLPAGMRGDDVKRHPVWIERGACYLDQVGFDPSGKDGMVLLNTWKGWPMLPKKGSCEYLLELLRYLCSEDPKGEEIYQWVLRWMAYPLQNPGAKMSSAIIMHGPQGTGKSTVFQTLAKIYGDYSTVLNQRGLEDKFNSDWSDSKLFILAEEVVTRAEMWHIKNELKELVTGDWIRINPKNIAAYRQRNQVNIAYLSNENQPLPIDNDDRRHCVIYTPPALEEQFYDSVFLELEKGGVEAFYDYLLTLDLGDFHPKKRPPMTEAKQSLIALSSPSETRFVLEWMGGDIGLPICPALASEVYTAYLKWCRANGESRPRPSNQFHGAVARLPGWEKKKARVYSDLHFVGQTIPRPLVIPPVQAMQAAGTAQPDGTAQSQWLTTSIINFSDAMKGEEWQGRHAA